MIVADAGSILTTPATVCCQTAPAPYAGTPMASSGRVTWSIAFVAGLIRAIERSPYWTTHMFDPSSTKYDGSDLTAIFAVTRFVAGWIRYTVLVCRLVTQTEPDSGGWIAAAAATDHDQRDQRDKDPIRLQGRQFLRFISLGRTGP
jgi:hypothetical protein